jgi:hypothetical protein
MSARDLSEIGRRMAEALSTVERQRELVEKFKDEGKAADASRAEALLHVLEDTLRDLQKARQLVVRDLRRPRATSCPLPLSDRR